MENELHKEEIHNFYL